MKEDVLFFSSLGVPVSAVSDADVSRKIVDVPFKIRNKTITVRSANQKESFLMMQKNPRNGLCCIYSESIIYQRLAAFAIFRRAIGRAFKKKDSMPYWHQLTNQFEDAVSRRELLQQPSLLVIDGLTDKSQPAKIELARDIITRYQNIPVILLVTTSNPIRFTESTFIQPNRLLWLEDQKEL